ncbi:Ribose-phosphate pyrophosphokinase (RPPK) (5-phospho-D-ribosyl alpha-1-diphosphate) (Phosphoribosyl diphosphate synthase) (Phosphoribosyl pyrophosphate synthase) (P-Rib-PP synthase) (PRPP synthase) (PRPPase), partial [Durusdinium trenchii]
WAVLGMAATVGAGAAAAGLGVAASEAGAGSKGEEVTTKSFTYYSGQGLADPDSVRVFAGSGNTEFAEQVSKYLGIGLGSINVSRFADGECSIKVNENVRGKHVVLIQSTNPPSVNDNFIELLLMVSTMRRSSAKTITVVMPYCAYSRSDSKRDLRSPIAARDTMVMLETMGMDRLISVDMHSGQMQGFLSPKVPSDNITAIKVGALFFSEMDLDPENLVVVAPNENAVMRSKEFWNVLLRKGKPNARFAMVLRKPNLAEKPRKQKVPDETAAADTSTGPEYEVVGDGYVNDCDAIIVQDIIDSAQSMSEAARALKDSGVKRVFGFATHGLFSGEALKRIEDSPLEQVVVSNTASTVNTEGIADKDHAKVRWISIAPLVAEAAPAEQSGAAGGGLDSRLSPKVGEALGRHYKDFRLLTGLTPSKAEALPAEERDNALHLALMEQVRLKFPDDEKLAAVKRVLQKGESNRSFNELLTTVAVKLMDDTRKDAKKHLKIVEALESMGQVVSAGVPMLKGGVAAELTLTLLAFPQDSTMMFTACKVLRYLSDTVKTHQSFSPHLTNAGVMSIFPTTMRNHAKMLEIQLLCVQSVKCLKLEDRDLASAISAKFPEVILQAMRDHVGSQVLLADALEVLMMFSSHWPQRPLELDEWQIFEGAVKGLKRSLIGLGFAFDLINAFADTSAAKRKLCELGATKLVIEVLDEQMAVKELQFGGCDVLLQICFDGPDLLATEQYGASRVLAKTMKRYMSDDWVMHKALAVLAKVACMDGNIESIKANGITKLAEEALALYPDNHDIQWCGRKLLDSLGTPVEGKSEFGATLANMRQCAISMQEMRDDVEMQRTAIRMILQLTSTDGEKTGDMVKLGAHVELVKTMQAHRKDVKVQMMGCRCLSIIAARDPDFAVEIMANAGAAALITAMRMHPSTPFVLVEACEAIEILATSSKDTENIRSTLCKFGVIEEIIKALGGRHDSDSSTVVHACCITLATLVGSRDGAQRAIKCDLPRQLLGALDLMGHKGVILHGVAAVTAAMFEASALTQDQATKLGVKLLEKRLSRRSPYATKVDRKSRSAKALVDNPFSQEIDERLCVTLATLLLEETNLSVLSKYDDAGLPELASSITSWHPASSVIPEALLLITLPR